jgi:hypothetical protein
VSAIVATAAFFLVVLSKSSETTSYQGNINAKGQFLDSGQRRWLSTYLRDFSLLMVVGVGYMLYHDKPILAGVVAGLALVCGCFSIFLKKGLRDKGA